MCGIAGVYSTNLTSVEREIFEQTLMLNVWRGKDSTGVIKIGDPDKSPMVKTIKSMAASPGFICSKTGNNFIWDSDKEIASRPKAYGLIGHTRHATKGDVNLQNAHPFRFPNVVGIHNGTISLSFEGSKEYGTDSEALYSLIDKYGIEEALNKVSSADPAYALVYVDLKEKTLNFIKNSRRPLDFTYLYNRSTLVWSSQSEMIDFVLERRPGVLRNEGWEKGKTGADGYFTLKDNQLMTIPIGAPASEAKLTTLNVKTPKFYSGFYGGRSSVGYGQHSSWNSWEDDVKAEKKESSKPSGGYDNFRGKHEGDLSDLPWLNEQKEVSKAASTTKAAGKAAEKEVVRHAHNSQPVHNSELTFRLSQGCLCCGEPINPNDHQSVSRVKWWNREHFACGDCYENLSGDTAWVTFAVDNELKDDPVIYIGNAATA